MKTLPLVTQGASKRRQRPTVASWKMWCLLAAYRKMELRFGQVPAIRGGFRDVFTTDVAYREEWCSDCG